MATLLQYQTKASLYDGPFNNEVGWPAAGMGYILKTESEKYVVIDGGHAEDAYSLLQLLLDNTNKALPEIEYWILTHPHRDHYKALLEIARNPEYRNRIYVKHLLFYFPEEFCGANLDCPCKRINEDMKQACEWLQADIVHPTLHTPLQIDDLTIEFLFIPYDATTFDNANQLSLIFTIQGKQKTCLITGDAYTKNLQYLVGQYGKQLQCDVLQMPHHGLCDTGDFEFYRLVNAKTVLIPISVAGDKTMHSDLYGDAPKANLFAEQNANYVIKAFEGTCKIDL